MGNFASIKAANAHVAVDLRSGNVQTQMQQMLQGMRRQIDRAFPRAYGGGVNAAFGSGQRGFASRLGTTSILGFGGGRSSRFGGGGGGILGGAGAVTGGILGANAFIGATAGFARIIKASRDYEETLNKFRQTFRELAGGVESWADRNSRAMQRSKTDLLAYSAQFQNFFVGFGFGRRQASEFSKQLSKLAIDLGSFHNVPDDEAARRLFQGLAGSTEALDVFGINAREARVKQQLGRSGITNYDKATGEQKVLARLNVILESTRDAQGDAERTANSFANSLRGLGSAGKELAINLGLALTRSEDLARSTGKQVGLFAPYVTELRDIVFGVSQWASNNEDAVRSTVKMATAAGALLVALVPIKVALGVFGTVLSPIASLASTVGLLASNFTLLGKSAQVAGGVISGIQISSNLSGLFRGASGVAGAASVAGVASASAGIYRDFRNFRSPRGYSSGPQRRFLSGPSSVSRSRLGGYVPPMLGYDDGIIDVDFEVVPDRGTRRALNGPSQRGRSITPLLLSGPGGGGRRSIFGSIKSGASAAASTVTSLAAAVGKLGAVSVKTAGSGLIRFFTSSGTKSALSGSIELASKSFGLLTSGVSLLGNTMLSIVGISSSLQTVMLSLGAVILALPFLGVAYRAAYMKVAMTDLNTSAATLSSAFTSLKKSGIDLFRSLEDQAGRVSEYLKAGDLEGAVDSVALYAQEAFAKFGLFMVQTFKSFFESAKDGFRELFDFVANSAAPLKFLFDLGLDKQVRIGAKELENAERNLSIAKGDARTVNADGSKSRIEGSLTIQAAQEAVNEARKRLSDSVNARNFFRGSPTGREVVDGTSNFMNKTETYLSEMVEILKGRRLEEKANLDSPFLGGKDIGDLTEFGSTPISALPGQRERKRGTYNPTPDEERIAFSFSDVLQNMGLSGKVGGGLKAAGGYLDYYDRMADAVKQYGTASRGPLSGKRNIAGRALVGDLVSNISQGYDSLFKPGAVEQGFIDSGFYSSKVAKQRGVSPLRPLENFDLNVATNFYNGVGSVAGGLGAFIGGGGLLGKFADAGGLEAIPTVLSKAFEKLTEITRESGKDRGFTSQLNSYGSFSGRAALFGVTSNADPTFRVQSQTLDEIIRLRQVVQSKKGAVL
jgi:hypothetical protein